MWQFLSGVQEIPIYKQGPLYSCITLQNCQYTVSIMYIALAILYYAISVFQYQVELHTTEHFDSGSDAAVTVQLFGERGDTGERRLMESKTNTQKFQAGAVSL